jgi:hypothetical protein
VENLHDDANVNRPWEIIRDINISAKASQGYYELKKLKLWFNKGCSKQAKLQWLKDPSQINVNNLEQNKT